MALTEQQVLDATEPVVFVGLRDGEIYGCWTSRPQESHEARYASDVDVQAFLNRPVGNASNEAARALILRRADELEANPDLAKQIEGLRLRLSLIGG